MWQGAGHAGLAGLRPWWLVPCSRAFMGPSCPVQSIQAPELLLKLPRASACGGHHVWASPL